MIIRRSLSWSDFDASRTAPALAPPAGSDAWAVTSLPDSAFLAEAGTILAARGLVNDPVTLDRWCQPVVLPACGHSLEETAAGKLMVQDFNRRRCPLCRTPIGGSDMKALPVNFALRDLLVALAPSAAPHRELCAARGLHLPQRQALFSALTRGSDTAACSAIWSVYRSLQGGARPALSAVLTTTGEVPLHLAVRRGLEDATSLLLLVGAAIDCATQDGDAAGTTPLMLAAEQGNLRIVRLLLGAGARVNQRCPRSGLTALMRAASAGQVAIVCCLLEQSAAIDQALNDSGATALYLATRHRHAAVVALLLARGAAVDPWTPVGAPTPLRLSVAGGHRVVAALLLAHGAPVDGPGEGGLTPLLHLVASKGDTALAVLLLAHGARVDRVGCAGAGTALHLAAGGGHAQLVTLLLQHGAAIDAKSDIGLFPLALAAQAGHVEVVARLLAQGAKQAPGRYRGAAPLALARAAGHEDVVELLQASALRGSLRARLTPWFGWRRRPGI